MWLILSITLIPSLLRIVIAKVNIKIHAGFKRHEDGHPTGDNFVSVFRWDALIRECQVCAARTIRFEREGRDTTALVLDFEFACAHFLKNLSFPFGLIGEDKMDNSFLFHR
jgi:hypothetical protein